MTIVVFKQESFLIKEHTRLHEIWCRVNMLKLKTRWVSFRVFNKRPIDRLITHTRKVERHGHVMIGIYLKKRGIAWESWEVSREGSDYIIDIENGARQWFEVTKTG